MNTEARSTEAATEWVATVPEIAPWTWWADRYQIPEDTLRAIHQAGRGPHMFPIGKRLYIRRTDWFEWINHIAERGGVTAAKEPRRKNPARETSTDPAPPAEPPPRRRGRPLKFPV